MSDGPIIKRRATRGDIATAPSSRADEGGSSAASTAQAATPLAADQQKSWIRAAVLVSAICVGLALPFVGYVAYSGDWFAQSSQPAPPPVPVAPEPVQPIPIDRDAVIGAVRSISTHLSRANLRLNDIDQFRSDIRLFISVGGSEMVIAAQKAQERIDDARKLITQYRRGAALDAMIVIEQARLNRDEVADLLAEERREANNRGRKEHEAAAEVLMRLLEDMPQSPDSDEGIAQEALEDVFPDSEYR